MVTRSGSAVGRAFAILRVLRRASSPLPLTSIAEQVGIAPSSAHSVLAQLAANDAVVQTKSKQYELGPSLFYIGSGFSRSSSLYRALWVELTAAAGDLSLTAALAVPWEEHHLILATHPAGSSDVTVPFGGRVPLDGGSWGKVFYAWSGTQPPELVRYSDATITERSRFEAELERVQHDGYAADRGEFAEGVGSVAAPVTSNRGYEGLASLLGPEASFDQLGYDEVGQRLASLAARASLSLGDGERMRLFGRD